MDQYHSRCCFLRMSSDAQGLGRLSRRKVPLTGVDCTTPGPILVFCKDSLTAHCLSVKEKKRFQKKKFIFILFILYFILPLCHLRLLSKDLRVVADNLDVIPSWIIHKRSVVIGMIMRPQPRRTIVPAASRQGGLVEGVHRSTIYSCLFVSQSVSPQHRP